MKVKLLDLVPQYERIKYEINGAIEEVLASQQFILGPKVGELEKQFAAYCGAGEAVGVASGSDAILLTLMALGVDEGDEVITTPYSFFSTASSITRVGAEPVFVDIDPRTYNIDPERITVALTGKTKAIIVVHLFGRMAEMDPVLRMAGERGIPVIEDACQAVGARYRNRKAGAIGTAGCFSFFPSKNLGGYGDGGMVVTNESRIAEKVRHLRIHGEARRYYHDDIGVNSRLDALQAAVLIVKLAHLDEWNSRRRENAARYDRKLSAVGSITTPSIDEHHFCTYHQYVIRSPHRDELKMHLEANGVGCAIYYPVPLHLQRCFAFLGGNEGDFPEAERAARETLALPMYPELSREQLDYVVDTIAAFAAAHQ